MQLAATFMEEQKSEFQARVERINARVQEHSSQKPKVRGDSLLRRLMYPLGFIAAFALGIGAVFLSRFVQYRLVGLPGQAQGSASDIIGFVIAGGAVFLISFLVKGNGKEFASVSAVAMLMTTFTFHNAVWAYPGWFENVYGPEWVDFIQDITEPSSIQLFTMAIKLG